MVKRARYGMGGLTSPGCEPYGVIKSRLRIETSEDSSHQELMKDKTGDRQLTIDV